MVLLSACSFGAYQEDRCKLNGDVSYLYSRSLLELNFPEDLDVVLPIPYPGYVVPEIINKDSIDTQIVGKQLNICPPLVFSEDIPHKSCLIDIENN